ncbi:hypothetical protein [Leptospira idonii]|uniref:Uncharacterized protein n=1 Tax=Leptospira idonii TaxID=1193500 RepID=A0A4R9M2Z9_9LEPT|nr:hypothetical protein [Leptospira idonii]TGN20127.1 hypothetical protein EHS15_05380 [Leptospira idonii]
MARQDNLKIFTTAILVVLLLSFVVFAIIYKVEILEKIKTIGKSNTFEKEDRTIAEKPWSPPSELTKESSEKETASTEEKGKPKTELPNLPSLEEMEPSWEKPSNHKSVSITGKKKETTTTAARNEKEEVSTVTGVRENIPEEKKEGYTVSDLPKNKIPKESNLKEKTSKRDTIVYQPSYSPKTNSAKKQPSSKKVSINSSSKKWNSSKTRTSDRRSNRFHSIDSGFESRFREMESKFVLQNQKNEKRFSEIEKRIDKLEKALGPN